MAENRLRLILALVALGAAGTAVAQPAPRSATYVASGGEPFWTLEVDAEQLRLTGGLAPDIAIPTPRQERIRGGYRYRARGLMIVIRHRPCEEEDARTYADTVHVTVNGYTARGCGGAWIGGEPLDGDESTSTPDA